MGGLLAGLMVAGADVAAGACAHARGNTNKLAEPNKPAKKCERFKTKTFNAETTHDFTCCPNAHIEQHPPNHLQNSAMTASVATEIEKIPVLGVNLEVMRIPAASNHTAPAASEPGTASGSAASSLGKSSRAPIVFLHEGLGSVAMWRDFPMQLCQATGRAGLVYSRRGYGQSDTVPEVRGAGRLLPDYMHKEAVEVLPELLSLCGIEKPILLGHSDGGTIALLHAAQFETEACIVMAPHLFVEDISIQAITAAREAYEQGDLHHRLQKFHTHVDTAFWQWNDIWLNEAFCSFNIEEECKRITCPLLAIQGFDDPYGTMAQVDALGDSPLHNKRRVLLKLERCGHSPHRDQTDQVLTALIAFLRDI